MFHFHAGNLEMQYSQYPNQRVYNFKAFIDRKFIERYGKVNNPVFANFRRKTKIACLVEGLSSDIFNQLHNRFKNYTKIFFTWNELVEGAEDAESLIDLHFKQSNFVSQDYISYYDEFKIDSDGYVSVYTDGACSNNGYSNAQDGIGVWFSDRLFL